MTEQPYTPAPEQPVTPVPEVTSDDRLWVLLSFLFTPIIPIVMMLMEDKKARPFIKYHAVPALILGVVEGIVVLILSFIPVVGCLTPLIWIINLIYGLKAYKGVYTDIPVITGFSKGQGWS